jgi:tartrate dehydrogenase/decarboxylase/D-malate dehydrogenase
MLDWLGRGDKEIKAAGEALYNAVAADLAENSGSRRGTREIGDAICERLKKAG